MRSFFFDEALISKDEVYEKLLQPNEEYDDSTKQLLELLFASFSIIIKRTLSEHLREGKYDNPSALMEECTSTPRANNTPESNFGLLDRLKILKPNSNDITIEAIIMCRNNKMSAWRDELSTFDRNKWMDWVKICKKEHYEAFLKKRAELRKLRDDKRLENIAEKKRKAIRAGEEREAISKRISEFGGLWENLEDVDSNMKKYESDTEKKEALKSQLKFRQKVLCQTFVDSDLYFYSKNKVPRSINQLQGNLCEVIKQVNSAISQMTTDELPESSTDINIIIPNETLHKEKLRLELLLEKEKMKLEKSEKGKKCSQPKAKKRKVENRNDKRNSVVSSVEVDVDNLPEISCIDDLIGKRVAHFTRDNENGKATWFEGTVLYRKPGTLTELIIRYDVEDTTIYAIDFSEFGEFVELIPIQPEWAMHKVVHVKCQLDTDDTSWWEKGRITAYKDAYYTVEFFDENEHEYETETFLLEEDYSKNDVRFM